MSVGNRILGAMTLVNAESGRVLDDFDLSSPSRSPTAPQSRSRTPGSTASARRSPTRSSRACCPRSFPRSRVRARQRLHPGVREHRGRRGLLRRLGARRRLDADHRRRHRQGNRGRGADVARAPHDACGVGVRVEPGQAARARRQHPEEAARSLDLHRAVHAPVRGSALLSAGGHPLPLHISSRGVNRVGEHGPLLGGFSDVSWHDTSFELGPGEILVAYTDGVTDAVGDDGTRFGLPRLCDTLARFRGRSASAVIEGLTLALSEFQIGAHADDTAALVLRSVGRGYRNNGRSIGGRESGGDRVTRWFDRRISR